MATEKKKKNFVEIFFLKKGRHHISRREVSADKFDPKEMKDKVCGYRMVKRTTKNGVPEGPKEWDGNFVCVNSSIMSKEELERNPELYRKLIDSMKNEYTHTIRFNGRYYLIDLA